MLLQMQFLIDLQEEYQYFTMFGFYFFSLA